MDLIELEMRADIEAEESRMNPEILDPVAGQFEDQNPDEHGDPVNVWSA